MRQKKDFNVPVTVLSGIDGSVQTKTDIYRKEIKSACKHASFVNMATMFFPSCDNVEATTWKRQLGSDNVENSFHLSNSHGPPPPPPLFIRFVIPEVHLEWSDNSEGTTRNRRVGNDNL